MAADAPLPAWITPAQYAVLRRLVATLDAWQVPYVASGGLAGNLHGSAWPLHDIDLDVPRAALPRLASAFSAGVRFGPAPYVDDEFDLELLGLMVDGVEVDCSAAESVVLVTPGGERVARPTALDRAERRRVGAVEVRALPLADLLAYKRLIGRTADVRDLEALGR